VNNPTVLLQEQIEKAEALKKLPNYSPRYLIWCDTTSRIIQSNFNSNYEKTFEEIINPSISILHYNPDAIRADFLSKIDSSIELLYAIIDEYNRFQHNHEVDISRSSALNTYDFHEEIKAVSLKLLEDKHYPQAVEEAFKRVVKEVKRIVKDKTGEVLDGDKVMNRAFGFSNQKPVIKFNQLQTKEDEDEQQGIMFLFKGIVGIRNKKAHDNVILNDPIRTIEYLSLASLLMRLLDQFSN